ncbi:uncharacterized protein ARMOST_17421 [Armillaria ostoyae]|uniref:Uncharacterized protein n=1 Tax=Armillaria ostoyae TaxID=47428 RepID=A0A284RYX6_ARMOS|nr:uncharacterized protein ARMOST_17421 [Armillaria ostoyae]
MDSPSDMEDWEVPVSEIRDYTYKLIDLFGFEYVTAFRNRAIETPLNEREAMMLAYEGEVLVKQSRSGHRTRCSLEERDICRTESCAACTPLRLRATLARDPEQHAVRPSRHPDDAPTLDTREYDRWFLLTVLGKPRHDDKKVSKERNVPWHYMCQDPHHELEDCVDFLHSKRDNEVQHHRASRDEPANSIYVNMSPVGPSGLTTTMPSQSYPPPQPHYWDQAHGATSPTSQPPTLAFAAGYSGWFGPPS